MKKILFTLLISLLFITPGLVSALELKDGTIVDSTNAHLYIEENASKINNFQPYLFPNGFRSVVTNYNNDILKISIYTSYVISDNTNYYNVKFSGRFIDVFFNKNESCFYQYWNSTSCIDMSSSTISLTAISGSFSHKLNDIIYISEDLYFNDTLVMEKNWNSVPTFYEVNFNIPVGASLVVKDKDDNIVSPESNNIYKLSPGNYSYSVSKSLYNTYTGTINVSDNIVIDVELDPILDLSHHENIFSSYKQYLLYLVPSIFSLENPFFFIVFGISILFSLFLLLRKLLKGRL